MPLPGADVTPPLVTSVTPHHGEFAVAADRSVVVEFNEPVAPASITAESFALQDGTVVAGVITVGADAMSATFDPDLDLKPDTVYKVLLDDQITDVAGNALQPTAWTFSTGDIVPGAVVDISYRIDDGPTYNGTGDDSRGNNDSAVQCGEIVEIYVTARNEGNILLSGLSGAFSESDPYVRLLYNINSPYPDLAPGASAENLSDWDIKIDRDTPIGYVFIATVAFSLLDPVELSLHPIDSVVDVEIPIECSAPEVIGFSPADAAVDVAVGSDIRVTFSKAVAAGTVTADTFTVDNGGPVAGTVTVAGNRKSATFNPDVDLQYQTAYTVTATAGIQDKAGNPLVPDSATFTTTEPDTTSPEVANVTPADGALDLPVGGRRAHAGVAGPYRAGRAGRRARRTCHHHPHSTARRTSSKVHRISILAYTWIPRDPDVFGQPTRPTSSRSDAHPSATSRQSSKSNPGVGSRSSRISSGWSRWDVRLVHGFRSRTPNCTCSMMSDTSSTTGMLPGRAEGNCTGAERRIVDGARFVKKNFSSTPPGQRFNEHGRSRTPRTAPSAHRR